MTIKEVQSQQRAYFDKIKSKTMADIIKVVYNIAYVLPDSDEDYIIAVDLRYRVAVNTNFYEADDFYDGSDYNYVLRDGIIHPGEL